MRRAVGCTYPALALASAGSIFACGAPVTDAQPAPPPTASAEPPASASSPGPASYTCGLLTVPIGGAVPGDAPALPNQLTANCFAWWELISLSWPTDGSSLGAPGNTSPVTWETYMSTSELFLPGGETPPAFGTQPTPPSPCGSLVAARAPGARMRVLHDSAKFSTDFIANVDDAEAFPGRAPAWLGAQNGTNLWYEVRVNEGEYDTIVGNGWYAAKGQAASIAANHPVLLPQGSYLGKTGAIELKAAWMEVTDPTDAKWNRYKVSRALVVDPDDDSCRDITVALVGLHIIHKTANQPTWLWATFEHVDNAPDQADVDAGSLPAGAEYNLYSTDCQPRAISVSAKACLPDGAKSPVTVGCAPNVSPPYYLGDGCPAPTPIQVTRVLPIDANAQAANEASRRALARYASDTVFQYYQLVNVIWSTNPVQDPTTPIEVPTPIRSMNPPTRVANTTLETYAQDKTCTDCHQYATTATLPGQQPSSHSADFSFVLSLAQ